MDTALKDFEERAKDVRSYLRMLERLDSPGTVLRRRTGKRSRSVAVEQKWRVIGKATAFLLIYNLVESAVRSGLAQLYAEVKHDGCTCDEISASIRAVWVDQKHRAVGQEDASPNHYRRAAEELVSHVVERRAVEFTTRRLPGAGSLDAAGIRKVCEKHGVVLRTHKNAKGGESLQLIKAQRNALAHGEKSFAECGRDVTIQDLQRMAKESEVYVRGFLRSVGRFIRRKQYRAPVAAF